LNEREQIEDAITAWNEGGPEAFLAALPEDIEWHAPPGFVQGDLWLGRESLREQLQEQFESVFTDVSSELLAVEEGAGGWLACVRQHGTHTSGVALDWSLYTVCQFEDGVLRRLWHYFDEADARRKAGIDG
jgi:ketosteroid isomerase-like protein